MDYSGGVFGLGWLELVIIGGGIMLVAGPVGLQKVVKALTSLQKAKSDLTNPGALQHFLLDDRPAPTRTDSDAGPADSAGEARPPNEP